VLRAVVIFAVLMGMFYGLIHSPYVGADPFQPHLGLVARSTGAVLGVLGQEITVNGTSVSSPDFSMEIVRGCDAIEPTAAFVAAVLASPVAFWAKIPGILIGAAAMLVINLIRLVSLYFVGVHFPKVLDIMHLDVWQATFVVLAICFWTIWVQWATRPKRGRSDAVG
jgi:exosortase/archaeosortase family protein